MLAGAVVLGGCLPKCPLTDAYSHHTVLGLSVGCDTVAPACGLSFCGLSCTSSFVKFGPESDHPKGTQCSLGSHLVSLPLYAIRQGSNKNLSTFKGRDTNSTTQWKECQGQVVREACEMGESEK